MWHHRIASNLDRKRPIKTFNYVAKEKCTGCGAMGVINFKITVNEDIRYFMAHEQIKCHSCGTSFSIVIAHTF